MSDWLTSLKADPIPWLMAQEYPWVRYRTQIDLLELPESDPAVTAARSKMLDHPLVKGLIAEASAWPGDPLTRHNDAKHPIHKLTLLADLGLKREDPGMAQIVTALMQHQSPEGAFESLLLVPVAFGGSGVETLSWMLCDSPTVLHALLRFGVEDDHPAITQALVHLASLIQENGWPCTASTEFGGFRGPGRKDDPCPYATLIAVKALSASKDARFQAAIADGAEMLLHHWENQGERKQYMFGIGSTYRQPKAPFIWYDILHVLDTLSRIHAVHTDPRYLEMLGELSAAQDEHGCFKAGSVWMAWKDWEFGQKKAPSPWITLLALRIIKRSAHKLEKESEG